MNVTLEISDALLDEARQVAASEATTLAELVEAGLREILRQRSARGEPFRLRDASVGGNGLRPELRDAGWDRIRDALHDRRGG